MEHQEQRPPLTRQDILQIVNIVEARLKLHLPNLERGEREDIVLLRNPSNGQIVNLLYTFQAHIDGCIGYRVWTLEAVPELLAHLLQSRATEKGAVQ